MSMVDELRSVVKINIPAVPLGAAATLCDFYQNYVGVNEVDVSVVKKWYKVLLDYVGLLDNKELVLFVRKMEHEQRRGFVTQIKNGMKYVFSDNSLAKSIYLLARKGFAPADVNDFYDCVRSFRLKCMQRSNGEENAKDEQGRFYSQFRRGALPSLNGWFLAHIHSVNEAYRGNYKNFESRYFVRGELEHWSYNHSLGYIARNLDAKYVPSDRKFFIAHFLRFLLPINQFLVPLPRYISGNPNFRDISSTEPMLALMRKFRRDAYGAIWTAFEKETLCRDTVLNKKLGNTANMRIDIEITGSETRTPVCERRTKLKADSADNPQMPSMPQRNKLPKACIKIPRWAQHPECHCSKIIRAFFMVANIDYIAMRDDIRQRCSNAFQFPDTFVERFDGNWASMKTDTGNQNGHVFDQADDGSVTIWPQVREILLAHRAEFCFRG